MMRQVLVIVFCLCIPQLLSAQKKLRFAASDEVIVTADLYKSDSKAPMILLFHRQSSSRGEYKKIAPRLQAMGFSCLAVDLRAGGKMNGVKNKTTVSAEKKQKPMTLADAEKDIMASINYVNENYSSTVILLGSSFSASLALKVALKVPAVVGVAAFSPAEHFPKTLNLRQALKGFKKPVFISSSKSEANQVEALINLIPNPVQFIPEKDGRSGALALWEDSDAQDEYWKALEKWLQQFKSP